ADLTVQVVAVETDAAVVPYLRDTLGACAVAGDGRVSVEVVATDFITASTGVTADTRLSGNQSGPLLTCGVSVLASDV
ncbi:MAG: hypothetical protein L0H84_23440, partial [Pseudonocardia sp.]|nr:hypothetical protein [Pseudonocardia sp.]